MLAQADEEVARKIEALRAQQKLEMGGLMLRIERNSAEHRCGGPQRVGAAPSHCAPVGFPARGARGAARGAVRAGRRRERAARELSVTPDKNRGRVPPHARVRGKRVMHTHGTRRPLTARRFASALAQVALAAECESDGARAEEHDERVGTATSPRGPPCAHHHQARPPEAMNRPPPVASQGFQAFQAFQACRFPGVSGVSGVSGLSLPVSRPLASARSPPAPIGFSALPTRSQDTARADACANAATPRQPVVWSQGLPARLQEYRFERFLAVTLPIDGGRAEQYPIASQQDVWCGVAL